MSCYLRHLEGELSAAGIRRSRENRALIHALIQSPLGEQDCPQLWKRLKSMLDGESGRKRFIAAVRDRWRQSSPQL